MFVLGGGGGEGGGVKGGGVSEFFLSKSKINFFLGGGA